MAAINYFDYGDPSVLVPVLIKTPVATQNDPLIRIRSAGVNPIDYRIRKGEIRWLLPGGFPRTPGYDVSGEIAHCDPSTGLHIGERVMAFLPNRYGGGYAEYVTCPTSCIAKIPESMSYADAAAIPLAGTTALQSLRDHGKIRQGADVLINGASGGVGHLAVQIAKAYDVNVTAVSSAKHESFVRSLGADSFIDYRQTDYTKLGRKWDLIFDAAGKSSYFEATRALTPKGRFVSTEPSLAGVFMSIATMLLPKRGRVMLATPSADDLRQLIRLYERGELKVTIDSSYPLDEAADAQQRQQDGVDRGKLILTISK